MLRSPMRSPMSAGVRGLARGGLTRITISGTAAQGQTLAASIAVADASGMGPVSYQWNANGSPIIGATGSTLLLTMADVGAVITVTASYTDGRGTAESVTSAPVGPVASMLSYLVSTAAAAGMPALRYDISDLSTMYSDAGGTNPATVDQPVGLVLDVRGGVGANVSPALEFSPGAWQQSQPTRADYTIPAGGGIQVTNDHSNGSSIGFGATTFAYPVVAGVAYLVSLNVEFVGGATSAQLAAFSTSAGSGASSVFTFSGTQSFCWRPTASAGHIGLAVNTATNGAGIIVRSVSIRQVTFAPLSQNNAPSRPILRLDATTGAYYLEFDGVDDFLVTPAVNFTTTDEVTVFAGARSLRTSSGQAVLAELGTSFDPAVPGGWTLQSPLTSGDISFGSRGSLTARATSAQSYPSPVSFVATAVAKISTDTLALRVNGAVAATTTSDQGTGNYGVYPLFVGRRGGTTLPWQGRLYDLCVVGQLVSDSMALTVERELAPRLGIAL